MVEDIYCFLNLNRPLNGIKVLYFFKITLPYKIGRNICQIYLEIIVKIQYMNISQEYYFCNLKQLLQDLNFVDI